ncbi:hypothetical protein TSTA_090510 [Talaromyces stipitatus ATCC 10500]|uniref:Uncharacterized protein n=1 Tax=Talaromyces stipitatus (strain ATCC 10500 / CBS 375.48 / QM 6759 / NRRL 1006) TaxID=441959 RepID=B8M1B6_TALSN|nr:uncharacterized protein TSTA_090510 [Talaromyces stipitatus ATCC 10500]EED21812.1 hypothetical protein TSTA_090510 [Talaromyces stipitatus ATCC 10500]
MAYLYHTDGVPFVIKGLTWNARWWLTESREKVKLVFVTSIQSRKREILFQNWSLINRKYLTRANPPDQVPAVTWELVLSRSEPKQPIRVPSSKEEWSSDVSAREPRVVILSSLEDK